MSKINKSEHDKTNKPVHPAKTQPGHLPSLIRGISVCLKKVWVLNPFGADTLADLSPCWVHVILLSEDRHSVVCYRTDTFRSHRATKLVFPLQFEI